MWQLLNVSKKLGFCLVAQHPHKWQPHSSLDSKGLLELQVHSRQQGRWTGKRNISLRVSSLFTSFWPHLALRREKSWKTGSFKNLNDHSSILYCLHSCDYTTPPPMSPDHSLLFTKYSKPCESETFFFLILYCIVLLFHFCKLKKWFLESTHLRSRLWRRWKNNLEIQIPQWK